MKSAPAQPPDDDRVDDARMRTHFGYQLKRTFNVIQADLARTLKPFDLRMLTYTALVLIVDNPGVRQSVLAQAMDIERPNLVVILDELERRELITRDRVPSDRRAHALRATLAGKCLCDKAITAVMQHEAAMMRLVTADQRRTATDAMLRIEQALPGRGDTDAPDD